MSAEITFLGVVSAHPSFLGLFVQVDILDCAVDEIAQGHQRVARPQSGSARHIGPGRRQGILRGRWDAGASMPFTDLSYASAVDAEVCRDVVLTVATRQHPLNNRYFTVVQSHMPVPQPELQSGGYATYEPLPQRGPQNE